MKKIVLLLLLWVLGANVQAATFDHSSWDALLKKYVVVLRGGQATQVNYRGLSADRTVLKNYLNNLSAVTPNVFGEWPKPDQLAFLINAYNAWTVELILTGYPDIESIKDLGSLLQSPWKKEFIPLLGKTRSLDDIEHGMIRAVGAYQEPRIHFAVNCASIGCPALRPEAYTGEQLSTQLEEATRLFLADQTRNQLQGNTLEVSSIFKWYREDFERGWGGFYSLKQFFVTYGEALKLDDANAKRLMTGEIDIDFLDYDWHLNAKL